MLAADTLTLELCERGFAVIAPAIPTDVIAVAVDAVENLDSGISRRNGGAVYAARNVLERAPVLRRCAEHTSVREHVEVLLGETAFISRAILFDKNPSANWSVSWHQDTSIAVRSRPAEPVSGFGPWSVKDGVPHVQPPAAVLESMLTVRIHLDDCGETNAPLRVIPSSHREGILDAPAIDAARQVREVVSCVAPAGGLLLMRPLLLHASSAATNPGHRRVLHLEWAAGELPGGLEWNRA